MVESSVLRVEGLSKNFGATRALRAIDLEVRPGRLHGLVGPNGSGKTTLFNCISGFSKLTSGSVSWRGTDISAWSSAKIARAGVVRTFQEAHVFPALSVSDNMRIAVEARRRTLPALPTAVPELLQLVRLIPRSATLAANLPYGDQRRLALAMALAVHPDILLLDEPAAGLAATDRVELGDLLRDTAASGVGILVIEHDMGFLMNLVSLVTVLAAGAKIFEGGPAETQASEDVGRAYLGQARHGPPD
jgi:ABC-type branched-subunit amino acid transport system ATPase component